MPTLLSTKKLTLPQKHLLLNTGIGLVEYDAIGIKVLELPQNLNLQKNLIFTSKNAVRAVLPYLNREVIFGSEVFCVGEKTAALLKTEGFQVVECENYGKSLATKIIKEYSDRSFTFFCGKMRREEIPHLLKGSNINFTEVLVYDTRLNKKEIKSEFDGILFFSPSGVKSFTRKNKISGATAFCIGTTTAAEAGKHTNDIIIANKPTIENVIVGAVKHFKNR
ncbi:uroporphyrinogen-III synthase [Antarcticibacterium flavum]|uniref:Uroporphyrinogen-III synthase n=1 Tax=Antarcticibacterium flavum TaxID=2058175 RepID=A0A5B7X4R3_9FLAO|nr:MULTISPECIES: uroporphyrinogen-III synthase [Antarcticibacterium]MCM4160600.1 uroporphyrinogen-III synthase [Antarcticibacterium sp. W02-3]QCY69741.1 uroporphyrinogen-III synthase [Antarcticibacterium flavum]